VFVDRALVSRIESSFARDAAGYATTRAELEPGCGAEAIDCAGGRVIYMGPGMYVNRAMGVGVGEPARTADVDFIVDFYASHSLRAEIELCPYADDVVRARAAELGFGLDWFRTVYARTIASRSPGSPRDDLEFTRVDASNFDTWAGIWIAQSSDPDTERRFTRARHAKPGECDFVVSVDGLPAAVCSVSIHDGLADLGGMFTRTEYRGRGLQAACLAHRMAFAAESGCDLALAGATPGTASARNIERAGFEALYTSVALVREMHSPA
jgi:GNAT superfamily N-acetyltransferase